MGAFISNVSISVSPTNTTIIQSSKGGVTGAGLALSSTNNTIPINQHGITDLSIQQLSYWEKTTRSSRSATKAQKYQKGLRFDGVNDYVQVSNSNGIFNFGTSNFSIATLFKPQSINPGNGVVLGSHNESPFPASQYTLVLTSGGLLTFFIRGNSSNELGISSSALTLNLTYHVVCVRSGTDMYLYVNGSLVASGNIPTLSSITTIRPFSMGGINAGGGYTQFQTMTMYDTKVFNKALTLTEVGDLYNKISVPSNCIADYRFNQQSGTTLTTIVGTNNGTLTNYTAGDTTIGSTNKWLYEDGTPYTGYS